MEKDESNPELPPEVLSLIFVQLKSFDLFSVELVCKSWQEIVAENIWKEVAKREFELPPHHKDLANQAKKYSKISNNIRRCRCVVTTLAVASDPNKKNHLIGYTSFNENTAVVNWIRRSGYGSGQFDYNAEAAIINIKTRDVKIVQPDANHNLVLYGPYLTQLAWNGYNIMLSYNNARLAEITGKNKVQTGPAITTNLCSMIIPNEELDMQHLIAAIDLDLSNSSSQYGVLKIQIYNLEEKRVMCDIKVEEFATRNFLYAQKPSIVFKGEKIYCVSCHSRKTLTEIDMNNPTVRTTRDMSILPEHALLTGINASFAFGVIQHRQAWCYNFATSTLATYSCDTLVYVVDATWYCGFFMVFESHALVFFDPYSEGETLKVVTRFVADPIQLCQFRICENGKLLLSTIYGSVKMLDFEHANDEIQLLAITGTEKSDLQAHDIKAYQLTETLTKIFGTGQYNARYFEERDDYRFGLFFTGQQQGGKVSINTKAPYGKLEYTSPYFEFSMTPPTSPISAGRYTHLTLASTHRIIVLFCERFDGENWRLTKPQEEQWTEALEKILSGSKCLVQ